MSLDSRKISFLFLTLALAGCGQQNKFEQTFSRPYWFFSVVAPELHSSREVDQLWQSTKRCCENDAGVQANNHIFYKSCYNAIVAHFDDQDLVVTCLWLMDVGADREQRPELKRFVVDNYPNYRNRVDNCVNCMPGDVVADVTTELAYYESSGKDKTPGIGRIEKLLDTRLDDISYWRQAEIYEYLGRLYLEAGVTQTRLERFKQAYARLDQLKASNEPLRRRFPALEKTLNTLLKATEPE